MGGTSVVGNPDFAVGTDGGDIDTGGGGGVNVGNLSPGTGGVGQNSP
jgi:hypothetical protein